MACQYSYRSVAGSTEEAQLRSAGRSSAKSKVWSARNWSPIFDKTIWLGKVSSSTEHTLATPEERITARSVMRLIERIVCTALDPEQLNRCHKRDRVTSHVPNWSGTVEQRDVKHAVVGTKHTTEWRVRIEQLMMEDANQDLVIRRHPSQLHSLHKRNRNNPDDLRARLGRVRGR